MSLENELAVAIEHYRHKRYAEAGGICEKALALQPRNDAILNVLGSVEFAQGNFARARHLVQSAIEINPQQAYRENLSSISIRLGCELLLSGDRSAALEAFQQARQLPGQSAKTQKDVESLIADTTLVRGLLTAGIGRADVSWKASPPAAFVEAVTQQLSAPIAGLAVVFFHVDLGAAAHPFAALHGQTWVTDYQATLNSAVDAARRSNPSAKVIVLTDRETDVAWLRPDCIVVRLPIDREHLMFSRMVSYAALAASGSLPGPALWLDSDVCLNRSADEVFRLQFDVGLTFRTTPGEAHMPFNEGVIMTGSGHAAAEFFGTCLGLYQAISESEAAARRYEFNVKRWRGGQLSLAAFTQWCFPPRAKDGLIAHGLTCRFFPCDQYNYTVQEKDDVERWQTKWALHFKGARKHLLDRLKT